MSVTIRSTNPKITDDNVAKLEKYMEENAALPEVSASDNGKVLQVINGVWESGTDLSTELETLTGKVTPTAVTGFSFDTTNVNTEGTVVSVYRIGKLIIVNIIALTAKIDLSQASTLITGLPKPITNSTSICWADTDSGSIPIRLRVGEDGDNGKISLWYDNVLTGKVMAGTIIYIEL